MAGDMEWLDQRAGLYVVGFDDSVRARIFLREEELALVPTSPNTL